MKILSGFFVVFFIICFMFIFCAPSGTSTTIPINDELLPEELKGLKIYNVAYNNEGSCIKIAVIKNHSTIAESYQSGKFIKEILVLQEENSNKTILIKKIISENDSIIVAKKY